MCENKKENNSQCKTINSFKYDVLFAWIKVGTITIASVVYLVLNKLHFKNNFFFFRHRFLNSLKVERDEGRES